MDIPNLEFMKKSTRAREEQRERENERFVAECIVINQSMHKKH